MSKARDRAIEIIAKSLEPVLIPHYPSIASKLQASMARIKQATDMVDAMMDEGLITEDAYLPPEPKRPVIPDPKPAAASGGWVYWSTTPEEDAAAAKKREDHMKEWKILGPILPEIQAKRGGLGFTNTENNDAHGS